MASHVDHLFPESPGRALAWAALPTAAIAVADWLVEPEVTIGGLCQFFDPRALGDAGPRLDVGAATQELLPIWLASKASEWENRLEWLPFVTLDPRQAKERMAPFRLGWRIQDEG